MLHISRLCILHWIVGTYHLSFLPTYLLPTRSLSFVHDWLPRWNPAPTQLGFCPQLSPYRLKSNGWPLPTSMYKMWLKTVTKSKLLQVRNKERNYIYAFCWGWFTLCKITGLCMGFKVQQRIWTAKLQIHCKVSIQQS